MIERDSTDLGSTPEADSSEPDTLEARMRALVRRNPRRRSRRSMSHIDPSSRQARSRGRRLLRAIPDEPMVPRAAWRLIEMGENAGLVTPANQRRVIDVLGGGPELNWDRTLDLYQCDRLDLLILIALLAADRHSAPLDVLVRETLASPESVLRRVEQLAKRQIVSVKNIRSGQGEARLTPSGQSFLVSLIYHLLNPVK